MKKRIVCLVLVFVMLASVFSACGDKGYVPTGHLRIKGNDIEIDWVMKIDGKEISADEYRYFFMNVAYDYAVAIIEEYYAAENISEEGQDAEIGDVDWTESDNTAVLKTAEEYAILNSALFDLAESYGIEIDGDDLDDIEKTVAEMKSKYGTEEEYISVLASNYISEEYYRTLLRSSVIQEKLSEYLTGDGGVFDISEEDMIKKVQEEYICVRYLMLSLDGEGSTEKRDRITEYAAAIENVDDLITYINIYSEDVSMKNNTNGRYISADIDDAALYAAVSELEVGEVSSIIVGDRGYYIAVRQAGNVDYITENVAVFTSVYQEANVENLLTAERADAVVEYNEEIYGKINVWDME